MGYRYSKRIKICKGVHLNVSKSGVGISLGGAGHQFQQDREALTRRYKQKVWQSYLENNKPATGRIFWVYGPNKSDITIIGLEPHPNDKKDAYQKITLSASLSALPMEEGK